MTNAAHTETRPSQAKLTHADLCQFTGDLKRYSHPLNRKVVHTPGVQYVAQAGQAFWLNAAMNRDYRLQSLQVWRLDVTDGSAVLTANADVGVEPFIRQEIPFTDFPLDHIEIWAGFDGNRWTLYLPSEH